MRIGAGTESAVLVQIQAYGSLCNETAGPDMYATEQPGSGARRGQAAVQGGSGAVNTQRHGNTAKGRFARVVSNVDCGVASNTPLQDRSWKVCVPED